MSETGAIKFRCEHVVVEIGPFAGFAELNSHRRKLLELGMLGLDASGIGFGNLSIRNGESGRFYITGSATGGKQELNLADYAKVVSYDFERNWLKCEGLSVASSESLTHAAVYESRPEAGAIIHCHNLKLWAELLNQVPTTAKDAEYGTPEMAYAVRRLCQNADLKRAKIFVMAGHEGGIVTFGKDLDEALGVLVGASIACS